MVNITPSLMINSLGLTRYGDAAGAAFILAIFLGLAFCIHFIMNLYLSTIAKKTGTTLDDALVSALKKPMYVMMIVTGGFLSLIQLGMLSQFKDSLARLYKAAIIVIVAYAASKAVSATIKWAMRRQSAIDSKVASHFLPVTGKVLTIFVYVVALIGVLDQMNIKVTALLASLGVASLAVALALQDTLANFFAGIYVMADRPVRVGDYIRLENGDEGTIADIGWRSTKIRTLTDNLIVMPNNKLAQSIVLNYSLPNDQTGVVVKLGVAYGSDLDKVEKIALAAAKTVQETTEGSSKGFEPFVRFTEIGPNNVLFTVTLKVDMPVRKLMVTHEVIKRIMKGFEREGISVK